MKVRFTVMAALAIAGCSRPGAQQATRTAPQATPSATASPAGAIPADLQGRWALSPADCDPAHGGDVRGLLTIAADGFAFGTSALTVDRVIIRPGRVGFDVSEPADGATESRRYAFRRSADGRQLTRERTNLPDQVYTRCPVRPS